MNTNSSIVFYNNIITSSDNLTRIAQNYKNAIVDKTGAYFYYKDGKWRKTLIESDFTFTDVFTGKKYLIKINKKCESSTSIFDLSEASQSSTSSGACNDDILFTVSVYDGTPSGNGARISGPIDMKRGDDLNFWSTGGILNTVVEGSVDVQTEIVNQLILPRDLNPTVDFVGWESDAIFLNSATGQMWLFKPGTGPGSGFFFSDRIGRFR